MVTGYFKSVILNTCGLKELEKEKRDIEQNKYRMLGLTKALHN